jgi:hypothetical protein
VARRGERRGAYRVLVGKPEGKRPLERLECRWEDNIKMDFQEIGWGDLHWIDVAQDKVKWRALVNAMMNRCIPKRKIFLTSCGMISFSRRTLLRGVS